MSFNWIDFVILSVLLYYLYQGFNTGLVYLVESFVSFVVSLWLAIKYHNVVAQFLSEKFGIAASWSTVLGYISVALLSEAAIAELIRLIFSKLPKRIVSSQVNRWLGSLLSLLNGFIIITFFLLLFLVLPIRGTIKKDIETSTVGSVFVRFSEKYAGEVKSALSEVTREAIRFLTIAPQSTERITLDINPKSEQLSVDESSEQRIFTLVNEERAKVGVSQLVFDAKATVVARSHSRDMFERRYFSHVSPEGKDAGDRASDAKIHYLIIGENLAYAPEVEIAHRGLMESEGHRRNILDPQFTRIGIGVIDSEIYGKMFTQVFIN